VERRRREPRPEWELDLESKDHLKTILFDILNLPIQRLTKSGKKMFGESRAGCTPTFPAMTLLEYAALDKFTLNKLCRPCPMSPAAGIPENFQAILHLRQTPQKFFRAGIDKNDPHEDRHLCRDGRIHAQFLLTGTRGGRCPAPTRTSSSCRARAT
jgi:hypothetical protein